MYLPKVINDIKNILVDLQPRNHYEFPNVYGIFNESEIVIDISEGEALGSDPANNAYVKLVIKVSIAIDKKSTTNSEYVQGEKDLDSLISLVIATLRLKVIPNSERIKFVNFQKFTPESGKFRALLEFSVNTLVTPIEDWIKQDASRIEEIRIRNL